MASKDSSCNFPRCNIDPSKLAVPEVFAPVSIKRFIGGLGAWIFDVVLLLVSGL